MDSTYAPEGMIASEDPHAPVTNEAPASAEEATKALEEPGDPGKGEVAATSGDHEDVPGYRTLAEMMGATEAGFLESTMAGELPPALVTEAPSLTGLRDIGEASFGEPLMTEAILGTDDRVRITGTTAYPWRAIASLLITAADNSQWVGTGWFVSPRTLITAGHCVFIKGSGVPGRDGWVKRITVIPGRNGSTMPYGQAVSTTFRSVSGWTGSGNHEFDYGAIIIPTPLGATVGTFGYAAYPDTQLLAKTVHIGGYPGDKPSGTLWYHSNLSTSLGPRKLYYLVDTMGGQSGAPVWRVVNGKRVAVAIHAYGGAVANHGTRINATVLGNINGWKL